MILSKKIIKPIPRSVLSIDLGRRRIGLAGCDPLGITVTTIPALKRSHYNEDLNKLIIICKKRKVEGLIIGLPLDDKGNPTTQSVFCEKYGYRLAKSLNLPLAWVNENSSSWEAAEEFNLKNDRTGKIDSTAAALLLQQWLKEGPELKTSA